MTRQAATPELTPAESEIMQVLWDHGEADVHAVVAHLGGAKAYTTILTLLRILEEKGFVAHRDHPERRRAHLYRAKRTQREVRRRHVRGLLQRLFGGDAPELVAGLIEDEELDDAELRRLRALIDDKLAPSTKQGDR